MNKCKSDDCGTQNSALSSVEADLALQQQIYVAVQRLSQEEHLSKGVKRSRLQQYQREERKLKDLQEAVFRLRLEHGRSSPRPGTITQRGEEVVAAKIKKFWSKFVRI